MNRNQQNHSIERATYTHKVELRAADDGAESRTVFGYAAKFNSESDLIHGWFVEIIEEGAFDDVLQDDVRALFNHDYNYILARSASNTLKIGVDNVGLWYEFEAPETSYGDDLICSIRRGDITQSSFGFTVSESEWEEIINPDNSVKEIRRIKKVKALFDVSPVTFPAYHSTEVTVRSFSDWKEKRNIKPNRFDIQAKIKLNTQKLLLTA